MLWALRCFLAVYQLQARLEIAELQLMSEFSWSKTCNAAAPKPQQHSVRDRIAPVLISAALNHCSHATWHSRNPASPNGQHKTQLSSRVPYRGMGFRDGVPAPLDDEAASEQLWSCSLGRFHCVLFSLNNRSFLKEKGNILHTVPRQV